MNRTIRVGIGTTREAINHEYGHLIEYYMIDRNDLDDYKRYLTQGLSIKNIKGEIYYDSVGNPIDIFLLDGCRFESEYQSRLYVSNLSDAVNYDGTINIDVLDECVSEIFRKYMNNEAISDEARRLIEGAVL